MGGLIVLLLLWEGPVIDAPAAWSCPSAEEVSERLEGLLVFGGGSATRDRVELVPREQSVEVRLLRADGTLVARRELPAGQDCQERAETAAVLVAAWHSERRAAEADPVTPRFPRPPGFQPVAELVAPAPRRPPAYELGAAPLLWLGDGDVAYGGSVRAAVWSPEGPLGATAALSTTFHDPAQAGSLESTRRLAFSAGLAGRISAEPWFLDCLAEGVLGWLVTGDGDLRLDPPRGTLGPGVSLGVRGGLEVAPGIEAGLLVAGWATTWVRQAVPDSGQRAVTLSRWGLSASLGLAVRTGR